MKVLIIADPIKKLNPLSDSSLCMASEAIRRGHEVYWATENEVEYWEDKIFVRASQIIRLEKKQLPTLRAPSLAALDDFKTVFIRKDPPFDTSYVRLCWLLSLAEAKVWMMNRPSLLIRYHEKLLPLEAHAAGFLTREEIIPTHLGNFESAKAFVKNHGLKEIIVKPFLGHGGLGVERMDAKVFLASKPSSESGPSDLMVQPFFKEVSTSGDRRVFFLDGEVMAHFVRMPKPGGFISNLAQGGSAKRTPLSSEEERLLTKVGTFLKQAGIVFAGADVIHSRISEINITSPTGLMALEQLEGKDHADRIIALAERSASQYRR